MSKIISVYESIDVNCPYCDGENEIWDFDCSVTIENTDIGRKSRESQFEIECEHCGKTFKIIPEMEIRIEK